MLLMVLYARFAIFYIDVVQLPQGSSALTAVGYSVIAQSIVVFLGASIVYKYLM